MNTLGKLVVLGTEVTGAVGGWQIGEGIAQSPIGGVTGACVGLLACGLVGFSVGALVSYLTSPITNSISEWVNSPPSEGRVSSADLAESFRNDRIFYSMKEWMLDPLYEKLVEDRGIYGGKGHRIPIDDSSRVFLRSIGSRFVVESSWDLDAPYKMQRRDKKRAEGIAKKLDVFLYRPGIGRTVFQSVIREGTEEEVSDAMSRVHIGEKTYLKGLTSNDLPYEELALIANKASKLISNPLSIQ